MTTKPAATWWVYLLASETRNRTYIGITLDLERRLAQHNGEQPGGARSTHAGRPWRIARVLGPFPSRSVASQVERSWKRCRGPARWSFSVVSPADQN